MSSYTMVNCLGREGGRSCIARLLLHGKTCYQCFDEVVHLDRGLRDITVSTAVILRDNMNPHIDFSASASELSCL